MPLANQFIIAKTFIDFTFANSDTEDGSFPWSDVEKVDEQFRVGKSVGTAEEIVVFDMAQAESLSLLGLYNINSASYHILGNTTSDMSSPAYDSGAITAKKNKFTKRYNSLVDPQTYAAFNYRYVAIKFPAGSSTDGQSAWQIGSLFLSTQDELLLDNTNWGLQIVSFRPAETITLLSGGDQSANRGERLITIEMSMGKKRDAVYFDQVVDFFLTLDRTNCLLFGFNGVLVEGGLPNEEYFFVMNPTADSAYALRNFRTADVDGVSFKEIG